jgi:hypothetical protein
MLTYFQLRKGISAYGRRKLTQVLYLIIHHWSSIDRLVSIKLTDIRLIFDDLDSVELTVKEVTTAGIINFEGSSSESSSTPYSSQSSRSKASSRDFPLAQSDEPAPTSSSSVSGPQFTLGEPTEPSTVSRSLPASPDQKQHRVKGMGSKMTSSASQIWSRAIGRAHGSIGLNMSITDVDVILPFQNPSFPLATKVSMPNLPKSRMSVQPSSASMYSSYETPLRSPSFASLPSLNKLFRPSRPRYAVPFKGGYERLFALNGTSRISLSMGFSPRKGLLGEDTLSTNIALGTLTTSLGSVEKLIELREVSTPSSGDDNNRTPEALWSSYGSLRVSLGPSRADARLYCARSNLSLAQPLPSKFLTPCRTRHHSRFQRLPPLRI